MGHAMELYRACYRSKIKWDRMQRSLPDEIDRTLLRIRRINRKAGVTGALLLVDQHDAVLFTHGVLIQSLILDPVTAGPLDDFQVIRMINDTACIGILIVNTNWKCKSRITQNVYSRPAIFESKLLRTIQG